MKDINEAVQEYQTDANAVLIDLRDADDFAVGHIPGAVNFTLNALRDGIRRIAKFATPIYLYCYTGNRSEQGVALLKAKGYENARNIGGMDAYRGALEGPEMTVRELRRAKGLSQAAFAAAIGVRQPTVAAYESGKANPSPQTVDRIRELYGVNLARTEKKSVLLIQNEKGQSISPEEGQRKIGTADRIVIRADRNEATWVRGRARGSIRLWEE